MEKHLVTVFNNLHEAEEAFHDLLTIVPRESISFVHKKDGSRGETADVSMDHPLNGILTGGAIGGAGGALFGMTTLMFPGLGILLAAGPVYGAIAGLTAGGFIGGLTDLGINQHEAENIESHVKSGKIVITVEAKDSQIQPVIDTLKRHEPAYLSEEPVSKGGFE
ncbi:DUF1269 domain-containing protein [Salipaludibacillus sp. CUR1]|uniref:DUF1269 domain-containing protein n=1 Tax=Salipaludibacillus sp. CUR1 TaxID=2820003 RepID=UPI001E49FFD5|nr:DUF1269 domain-containing protein [Salipaludibacillus sp. CUR1]MCE7793415.1 DUF1269 domain-containing protein [Salipaludibacillus sp. CUR1]